MSAPSGPIATSGGEANPATQIATAAMAAARTVGVKPNVIFPPRPSASPEQIAASQADGLALPLYTGTPAPMGLAYYGLSNGTEGVLTATVLNTTSLVATVDLNGTGVRAADLFQTSPDSFGIQLNAVLTNVTLFGTPGYSFWTQNVVEYYPATDTMFLVTNVWNFSSPTAVVTPNALYGHGPYGTSEYGELGFYYAEYPVLKPIQYPFDLALYLNSTLTNGRDNVTFSVGLTSSAHPGEGSALPASPWDWVEFNSTGGAPLTVPSNYTANGLVYNPLGLTNDFELIFGGPGGGSQATLADADATLGLGYWDGSGYVAVPAAFDYGGETGETVTGANIAWSNASAGRPMPSLATYGTMTTGPSFLSGLWNASVAEGSYPVALHVTPTNAIELLTATNLCYSPLAPEQTCYPCVRALAGSCPFLEVEAAVAPEGLSNALANLTLYLTPGNYTLTTELSDYAPSTTFLNVSGPLSVTVALTANPSLGVYTPLWAFSDYEVRELAVRGTGTTSSPYVMPNVQPAPLAATFGLYNDWGFPAYPAVFLYGTNVTTEFLNPPSFNTTTSTFQFPGPNLPPVNQLQYWFWNDSRVGVLNATNISGWFASTTYYPTVFNTFSMIFYEGNSSLVARSTFAVEGQGLLVFAGGGVLAPPWNVGGTNVTVWGNFFLPTAAPDGLCPAAPKCLAVDPLWYGTPVQLGLELAGPSNTVYNNYFETDTTAWVLPINLYSGLAATYPNAFSITPQPANNVHYAPAFPAYQLTGCILGAFCWVDGIAAEKDWQGGNYWWDYGNLNPNPYNGAFNAWNALPYDENASTWLAAIYPPSYYHATFLYPGGDAAPLTGYTIWRVTFQAVGLPTNDVWDVAVDYLGAPIPGDTYTGTASSFSFYLPNGAGGTYSFEVSAPHGYEASPASSPNMAVYNHQATVVIHFSPTAYLVTFKESGLTTKAQKKGWFVEFNGIKKIVTAKSISFSAPNGTSYPYLVAGPNGWVATVSPAGAPNGNLSVAGAPIVESVVFAKGTTFTLTFKEIHLPAFDWWCVNVSGTGLCSTGSTIKLGNLSAGSYYWVVTEPPIPVTPSWGRTTLPPSTTITVRFY